MSDLIILVPGHCFSSYITGIKVDAKLLSMKNNHPLSNSTAGNLYQVSTPQISGCLPYLY